MSEYIDAVERIEIIREPVSMVDGTKTYETSIIVYITRFSNTNPLLEPLKLEECYTRIKFEYDGKGYIDDLENVVIPKYEVYNDFIGSMRVIKNINDISHNEFVLGWPYKERKD